MMTAGLMHVPHRSSTGMALALFVVCAGAKQVHVYRVSRRGYIVQALLRGVVKVELEPVRFRNQAVDAALALAVERGIFPEVIAQRTQARRMLRATEVRS